MNTHELQLWLNARGASIAADGKGGPATRAAIPAVFANAAAQAVTDAQMTAIAGRLGCTTRQLRAVAKVESAGGGFDRQGRPKILFERHHFYRRTAGAHGVCAWSNSQGGGYDACSWDKLARAAMQDAEAAFASASWGEFQVMGGHALKLGYPSALDMAWSAVSGEAAHYEMLARYVDRFGLKRALAAISGDPETCRAFAAGYNGPGYRKFDYHLKIARAHG